MAGFPAGDASFFVMKVINNRMVVRNDAGVAVFVPETAFSLGNYVLLAIVLGMYFAYRRRYRRTVADRR